MSAFPQIIRDPWGPAYVLADNETEALDAARDYFGDVERLRPAGWMCKVPYPEDYESREEWEESPNFCESWWEGCQEPVNDKQREHVKQSWEVIARSRP